MLGGSGGMLPQGKFFKLGALRSLLRPYLHSNATSPTRVHGGSNTAVRHDTTISVEESNVLSSMELPPDPNIHALSGVPQGSVLGPLLFTSMN